MDFDKIIGNDLIKKKLEIALKSNVISNSLLFAGPDAVGKSLFAIALSAKLMYSGSQPDASLKKKIYENNHPDLHIYLPEGKSFLHSISSIRNLIEQVNMAPFEAKAKVFIIKDADRMLQASANALLKTLEEPTYDSYIIMITSNPDGILPTISSRCFKLNFSSVKEEEIFKFLQEKYSYSPTNAENIAKIANGSIGKAIEIANSSNFLKKRDVLISILSKEKSFNYFDFSETVSKLDDLYMEDIENEGGRYPKEIEILFENIYNWYRDLHLLKIEGDESRLFYSDRIDLLRKQDMAHLTNLEKILGYLEEAKNALVRNIRLKHVLENFFMRLNFV